MDNEQKEPITAKRKHLPMGRTAEAKQRRQHIFDWFARWEPMSDDDAELGTPDYNLKPFTGEDETGQAVAA